MRGTVVAAIWGDDGYWTGGCGAGLGMGMGVVMASWAALANSTVVA